MTFRIGRRELMRSAGAAALAESLVATAAKGAGSRTWPIEEGPNTPKICLAPRDGGSSLPAGNTAGARADFSGGYGGYLKPPGPATATAGGDGGSNLAASYRRILQLGVNYVLYINIKGSPWTVEAVRQTMQSAKDAGLAACHAMINVPPSILYGLPDRSKDMEVFLASIDAAGKAGLPIVEYNFYAHRIVEGYYETVGRGGAGYTAFDDDLDLLIDENNAVVQPIFRDDKGRIMPETLAAFPNARRVKVKDLPPLPGTQARTLQEMWANITWFLKAAVPAAEKANVRLALHPNDPPAPLSRGSQQIMGSLEGWKHLIEIVDSPANGITFDCGVTRELGEDPVAVAQYFASRKRINHAHYRNVIVQKPSQEYQEVFVDNGMVDMFGVMLALVRNGYDGWIYPEHQRALDYDRDRVPQGGRIPGYPGGGGYTGLVFNVAYTRAMLQAALASS